MESPYYLTTGEPLLISWLFYSAGHRHAPKVVQKSRKQHSCALGCKIKSESKYLKFDIIDGDGHHMGIGLCDEHFPKFLESIDIKEVNEIFISQIDINQLMNFLQKSTSKVSGLAEIKLSDITDASKKLDFEGIPAASLNSQYWIELSNGREYPFKHLTRVAYKIATGIDEKLEFISSPKNRDIIEKLGIRINHYPENINFFKNYELKNYSAVAGKKYRGKSEEDQRFRTLIQPNVKKLNFWASNSVISDFTSQTDNHWQWSGTFKSYLWIRIYRKGDSKKVFFVFGINSYGELYLELNCQLSNHTGGSTKALHPEKVKIFKDYLDLVDYSLLVLNKKFIDEGNWNDLISIGKDYIRDYERYYDDLESLLNNKIPEETEDRSGLLEGKAPKSIKSYANRERTFKGTDIDWDKKNRSAQKLGKSGEELVIEFEKNKLRKISGLEYLVEEVRKVKDGEGYDILSFDEKGKRDFH